MSDDLLTSDFGTFGDLITVATFDDSVSASLALNRLKDAGMPAVLSHENAVTWFWYLSTAIGGIEVQVNAKDAETARSLIEEHVQITEADVDAKVGSGPGAEAMMGDEATEYFNSDPEAKTMATHNSKPDREPQEEPPPTQRECNADRAVRSRSRNRVLPAPAPALRTLSAVVQSPPIRRAPRSSPQAQIDRGGSAQLRCPRWIVPALETDDGLAVAIDDLQTRRRDMVRDRAHQQSNGDDTTADPPPSGALPGPCATSFSGPSPSSC